MQAPYAAGRAATAVVRIVAVDDGGQVHFAVLRQSRSERRPSPQLLADLAAVSAFAEQLDVVSPAEDFDVGLTTDDM